MTCMKWTKYLLLLLLLLISWLVLSNYHPDISLDTLKERYTYPDSRFLSLNGMDVHYRQSGEGPNLLLIHGTGASLHTWEAWTEVGHVPMEEIPERTAGDVRAFLLRGEE